MSRTITREQIKENLDNNVPMILIEALPKEYFDTEHLPSALNIPHNDIEQKAPELLTDKNAFLVVYCASTECKNSKIATDTLLQIGYTNVYEYVEGKKHWLEANFSTESVEGV